MNGSFGGGFVKNSQQYSNVQTQARNSQDVNKIVRASKITKHKCAICGKTENDGDDLEFRFCSKCDGNYEYCSEHLYTHVHIKTNDSDNVTSI